MPSRLPAPREIMTVGAHRAAGPSSAPTEELKVRDVWGLLRRNRWIVIGVTVVVVAAATTWAIMATPVYEAATTIRIEDKEANLPGIFRTLGPATMGVGTEIEVLKSRTLAEDAISALGLQLVVVKPRGPKRSELLQGVSIEPTAKPGVYQLEYRGRNVFWLTRGKERTIVATGLVGKPLEPEGFRFIPTAAAAGYATIELRIDDFDQTRVRVTQSTEIATPNREAQIAIVRYRDTDQELVYQVPNMIARRFMERRQENQSSQARSTVVFLRSQLDTLAAQLSHSEETLRRFRERQNVVDPGVEATAQVNRYVALQADRSSLEAERASLARLMSEVERTQRSGLPDEPSPYRRLLGFPTLLRNQSATDLMRALTQVEDERSQLLGRRTFEDPDVQARTHRIREIEEQLRLTVSTYLQGLTNQASNIDTTLRQYTAQLSTVPSRQLEFARLQRQPKVLEEMYALLQTRLKEAEISQAIEDASIRVVDPAVEPVIPVFPRRTLTVLASLVIGLLLGVALAFLRELLDRSIHTRSDVLVATGLPVLGLIPHIPGKGKVALIAAKASSARARLAAQRQASRPAPQPQGPPSRREGYTFLPALSQSGATTTPSGPETFDITPQVTIPGIGTAVTEAYGSLQTNLLYSRGEGGLKTVVFTSAVPGEGKTTNAVNLALTLAQRGVKVVIVDADIRRGMVHQLFDVKREPGLTDVLSGTLRLADALHVVKVEDGGALHFVTSGRLSVNPIAVLESSAMRDLLAELASQFDTVILDAPPVNMLTDAAVLGANADGVVIVVRAGVTQSAALEYAMQQLSLVQARVLGVVLNDIDFERDAAYDAAYQYYQYQNASTRTGV